MLKFGLTPWFVKPWLAGAQGYFWDILGTYWDWDNAKENGNYNRIHSSSPKNRKFPLPHIIILNPIILNPIRLGGGYEGAMTLGAPERCHTGMLRRRPKTKVLQMGLGSRTRIRVDCCRWSRGFVAPTVVCFKLCLRKPPFEKATMRKCPLRVSWAGAVLLARGACKNLAHPRVVSPRLQGFRRSQMTLMAPSQAT